MPPIRVLLCDDSVEFRALLRILLEEEGDVVVTGEAEDGEVVTGLAAAEQPDVVLLDLNMPRRDGLEALPHLRAAAPDARVVVLSGMSASRVAGRARELGAHGYVEKGCSARTLRAAVRAAAAGVPLPVASVSSTTSGAWSEGFGPLR